MNCGKNVMSHKRTWGKFWVSSCVPTNAMREKKVTQSKMADFLGIKLRSYQNYEGGSRRPDYEGLVALADYFDVTTDYLLGRSDVRG